MKTTDLGFPHFGARVLYTKGTLARSPVAANASHTGVVSLREVRSTLTRAPPKSVGDTSIVVANLQKKSCIRAHWGSHLLISLFSLFTKTAARMQEFCPADANSTVLRDAAK